MAVYRVRSFSRWARKQRLSDSVLCDAVREMRQGVYEANLGGGLLKKRIARPGQGKSGGYRTIVATNNADRWFFLYGFAKSERANIDHAEEAALKKYGKTLLSIPTASLAKAQSTGEITKVKCEGEETLKNS